MLETEGPLGPILIRSASESGFTAVVMPVRLLD